MLYSYSTRLSEELPTQPRLLKTQVIVLSLVLMLAVVGEGFSRVLFRKREQLRVKLGVERGLLQVVRVEVEEKQIGQASLSDRQGGATGFWTLKGTRRVDAMSPVKPLKLREQPVIEPSMQVTLAIVDSPSSPSTLLDTLKLRNVPAQKQFLTLFTLKTQVVAVTGAGSVNPTDDNPPLPNTRPVIRAPELLVTVTPSAAVTLTQVGKCRTNWLRATAGEVYWMLQVCVDGVLMVSGEGLTVRRNRAVLMGAMIRASSKRQERFRIGSCKWYNQLFKQS